MKLGITIQFVFSTLLCGAVMPEATAFFWSPETTCPTIETVADFDITEYTRKTWFVQRMQPISYLMPERFYCVTATYSMEGVKQWGQEAISVRNYANTGAVNGPDPVATNSNPVICATRPNPETEPAKLVVIPCFLPPKLGGPYWVVAVAPDYSWSIIVGGQPLDPSPCEQSPTTKCTTGEPSGLLDFFNGNNQGLWFFSRDPIANQTTLDLMEATADSLGLCTAKMRPVAQEGCLYEGSSHK